MSVFEQGSRGTYAFGPFVLMPERQSLMRGDAAVRIGGRALDILTLLVERAGELVSKAELNRRVWPNLIVDEGNLKVNIAALRRTLGEDSGQRRYIETVPGHGYRFVADVQTEAVASPQPMVGRHGNLPAGGMRIFGRNEEIDAIREAVSSSRLVSIIGTGGIGKTTVALAVADRTIGKYRDGVWLVDFAPLKEPSLLANAIAMAIGLAAHSSDVLSALCRSIQDREMLLVLDNCEHLTAMVAACTTRILDAAPAVKLLVTSRESLGITAEHVHILPGLATPTFSSNLTAESAMTFPAVQLFADRAAERLESFVLTDADAPIVADICRGLDGIALAIELAAMRIDIFGVRGLHTQLDDRFRLLAGRRGGLERHRTLSATLDWSYSLLSAQDAQFLRTIAIFAGVFDIAGASAVSGSSAHETEQALMQLAAKSLLAVDLSSNGVAYRLLQTTRAYCLDRQKASGEEDLLRRRHAEHICAVLGRASVEWTASSDKEWGAAYWGMIDDLRGALDWAEQSPDAAVLQIQLTTSGLLLWNHFSLTGECRVHVARAIEELEVAQMTGTAFEMQLKAWLGSSTIFTRGILDQTVELTRQALEIAIRLDDVEYKLRCLRTIGLHELFNGQHIKGLASMEAFAAVAAGSDRSAIPDSESHIAIAELFLGRLASARTRLERLRTADVEHVNFEPRIRYQSNRLIDIFCVLTQVQWLTGSPDSARQVAKDAIERARADNHHLALSTALSYACPVYYWTGDYELCALHVDMLDQEARRHGFDVRRPVAMFYRAALACMQDTAGADAIDGIREAIAVFRTTGHLARMPFYLAVLAEFTAKFGQVEEAEHQIESALEYAYLQNEMWCMPELLRIKAAIWNERDQTDEPEAMLARSIEIARETGALSWQLRSATDLARLQMERSDTDAAYRTLSPVVHAFSEGFQSHDLVAATALLDGLRSLRQDDLSRASADLALRS
jgi:predicted ATPase/DNA-binding winged helix-turn-helix (wHTH) protein